jgi:hypothetical protein
VAGAFVPLACDAGTLDDLSSGLKLFGPATSGPDWLISAVWLCTAAKRFIATSSTEVLPDGYVARRLTIHEPEIFASEIEAALPGIHDRLRAHGRNISLPATAIPQQSAELAHWPEGPCSLSILARVAGRPSGSNQIACGLLFESADRKLLVGTDRSSMAMVLSETSAVIDDFMSDCVRVSLAEYEQRSNG